MPRRQGQRKVLKKRKRSKSAPAVLHTPTKKRRKQWTNEQMKNAMEAVETTTCGVNEAARVYGVPATTLKDRVSGRVKHGTKSGPPKYLSDDEEKELADFLKESSEVGFGKTRRDVLNIAESYAKQKGVLRKESGITQGWWRSFRDRQGDLSLRRGDNTAHVRMDAVNEETISDYFALLQTVMQKHGITNSPGQIYNVDESGVPLDPKAPNIVTKTGAKKVRYRSTGRKGQITIVACGSATGQVIPPTVIFEAKGVNHAWTSGGLPGMTYGYSDSGWITTDLFESWLSGHFLKHAVCERPLLLLLDGHSTHYQPEVVRHAKRNEVLLLCLPPHTTHEAQPLDCTVFSPLKAQWRTVCHDFFQTNPGKVITKFNFVSLFVQAWSKAVIPTNIISGFRTCGVYPLNVSAIRVVQVRPERNSDNDSNAEHPCQGDMNVGDNSGASTDERRDGFTLEQEMLFKRRYEEGHDLYVDANYIRWMRLHHPEVNISIPTEQESGSLLDSLQEITPISPIPIEYPEDEVTDELVSMDMQLSAIPEATSSELQLPVTSEQLPTNSEQQLLSPGSAATSLPPVDNQSTITIITSSPKNSTPPLREFLIYPVTNPSTSTTPAAPKRSVPKARLLTSDESLAMLEEKEKAKKDALIEKERKKAERIAKKQQREEEMKRKREEKARKAEEKAREKAMKQQEKAKVSSTRGNAKRKPKDQTCTKNLPATAATSTVTRTATSGVRNSDVSVTNTLTVISGTSESVDCTGQDEDDEAIDPDTCCMCFGRYEDDVLEGAGAEWIYCGCGRWVHEDCVEETVMDSDGQQRLCTFCVDKYTV